jgi:peptidyl-dipeptidase A
MGLAALWGAGLSPRPALAAAPKTAAARSARKPTAAERDARAFLETMTALLQPVSKVSAEAAWASSTDVTPVHTGERAGAEKAAAALTGSRLVIERTKALLARERELDPVTARQLRKLLLAAAANPGTIPEVVARRIEAEATQSSILDGFSFCLQPGPGGRCARPASANDIDQLLRASRNLAERERVWNASKEVGRPLKPGLEALVGLRNQVAREMGYSSFFALQVADYGMTVPEMMTLLDATLDSTRPLYEALHCWAKNALADRYKKPAPRLIPAHWVGNRWAQTWPGLVDSVNLDPLFKGKTPEAIVRTAEDFYVALGFPRLPETFWKKSDLYPVDKTSVRKKNAHASAWHIDGEADVRSLMSVEPNQQWFGTAHHELGHIYYYLSYSRPEVPFLLREGANRAFHEAVGELARLASEETPYLRRIGLLRGGSEPDANGWLLAAAMDSIVFLPFAAGTMSHFEHDLYEKALPPSEWQDRWWQYVGRFQGVEPPAPRPAELCDACTKTHINDDPAQYYDYALATLIKFQLHDHICSKILKQDVRSCDYGGDAAVGEFLRGVLKLGATRDWRTVIKEATGEEIGPRALLAFFEPLGAELARRNQGKDCAR